MNQIIIKLYYHLKEKAGTSRIVMCIPPESTIADLKKNLIKRFPTMQSHLDNILVLINQKIALNEDPIPPQSEVDFMTPISGG